MDPGDRESTRSEQGEDVAPSGREHRREWRRDRTGGGARKERVLHTRISEQLAGDIRQIAEDLRVPVSNLVRNVLEETFSVVERVSDNVGGVIEEVIDEAARARDRIERRMRREWQRPQRERGEDSDPHTTRRPRPEFSEVAGWQPLILNRANACADCGAALRKHG